MASLEEIEQQLKHHRDTLSISVVIGLGRVIGSYIDMHSDIAAVIDDNSDTQPTLHGSRAYADMIGLDSQITETAEHLRALLNLYDGGLEELIELADDLKG